MPFFAIAPPPASAPAPVTSAAVPPLTVTNWREVPLQDWDTIVDERECGSEIAVFHSLFGGYHFGFVDAPATAEALNRRYSQTYPHGEILVERDRIRGVRRVWSLVADEAKACSRPWQEADRVTQWQWTVPPAYRDFLNESSQLSSDKRKATLLFTPRAWFAAESVPASEAAKEWRDSNQGEATAARNTDPLLVGVDAARGCEWQQAVPLAATLRRYKLTASVPMSGGGCVFAGPRLFVVARADDGRSVVAYNLYGKTGALLFLCGPGGRLLRAVHLPGFTVEKVNARTRGGWIIVGDGPGASEKEAGSQTVRTDADGVVNARGRGY